MVFRLLDLPTEIRLQIFRSCFFFLESSPISCNGIAYFPFGVRGSSITGCAARSSQILRTCKTCYREGFEILYSETTFLWESYCDVEFFLKEFPKDGLRYIKHLFLPPVLASTSTESRMRFDFDGYARLFRPLVNLLTVCLRFPNGRLPSYVTVDTELIEGPIVKGMLWREFGQPNLWNDPSHFAGFEVMEDEDNHPVPRLKDITFRLILDCTQMQVAVYHDDGEEIIKVRSIKLMVG
jgi:hypothetical protein